MAADCLEKMVAALEANPDCYIAHCPLRVIDEHGRDVSGGVVAEYSCFPEAAGNSGTAPMCDLAPFDGLLHLGGDGTSPSLSS